MITQGAKLVATWEDVCEELPANVRLALTPAKPDESQGEETASLFPSDDPLGPHERKVFALLKADEATQIDEIVDRLEPEMSSSEILAALFELELAREGEAVAGEEFCEELLSFQLSAVSEAHEYKGGHAKTKSESVGEGHTLSLDVYASSRAFPREENLRIDQPATASRRFVRSEHCRTMLPQG